jgi:hypothetical protein
MLSNALTGQVMASPVRIGEFPSGRRWRCTHGADRQTLPATSRDLFASRNGRGVRDPIGLRQHLRRYSLAGHPCDARPRGNECRPRTPVRTRYFEPKTQRGIEWPPLAGDGRSRGREPGTVRPRLVAARFRT